MSLGMLSFLNVILGKPIVLDYNNILGHAEKLNAYQLSHTLIFTPLTIFFYNHASRRKNYSFITTFLIEELILEVGLGDE